MARTIKRVPATTLAGYAEVVSTGRAKSQRDRLMMAWMEAHPDGLTDAEAAVATNLDRAAYWNRCHELREHGIIQFTNDQRPSPITDKMGLVSVLTPAGRILHGQQAEA